MAGSLRLFQYIGDNGTKFTVKVDESNGEATLQGMPFMPNRDANHPYLPKGHKMRYVLAYDSAAPARRRKFYIGDPSFLTQMGSVVDFAAPPYPGLGDSAWVITAYRGEKVNIPPSYGASQDTGLNDGDNDSD